MEADCGLIAGAPRAAFIVSFRCFDSRSIFVGVYDRAAGTSG
jgi:hypothetical protein